MAVDQSQSLTGEKYNYKCILSRPDNMTKWKLEISQTHASIMAESENEQFEASWEVAIGRIVWQGVE